MVEQKTIETNVNVPMYRIRITAQGEGGETNQSVGPRLLLLRAIQRRRRWRITTIIYQLYRPSANTTSRFDGLSLLLYGRRRTYTNGIRRIFVIAERLRLETTGFRFAAIGQGTCRTGKDNDVSGRAKGIQRVGIRQRVGHY